MAKPGRSCPRHYRYSPAVFARAADIKAQSLYVVGGLYGNPFALETVLALARREGAMLVFNGDFNWFNADPTEFREINDTVLRHIALRGNVETEIAGEDSGAGCGCGYPEWVGDGEVERSNEILERLRETARGFPDLCARLGGMPMHLVAEVGDLRVGIAHGVDVFACTHTCLPVMQDFATPRGTALIVNNGAAGMPNFRDTRFGLATRIASAPSTQALYGTRLGKWVVEAVPVRYDYEAWIARFDRLWPAGSPASLSYRKRIASGPDYKMEQAVRTGAPAGPLSCVA